MKLFFISLASLIILTGCDNPLVKEYRDDGVEVVFYHQTSHFSYGKRDLQGVIRLYDISSTDIAIKTDVPEGEPMFVDVVSKKWTNSYVIHLHNVKEINGAGWDAGKAGSGQTIRIE